MAKLAGESGSRRSMLMVRQLRVAMVGGGGGGLYVVVGGVEGGTGDGDEGAEGRGDGSVEGRSVRRGNLK